MRRAFALAVLTCAWAASPAHADVEPNNAVFQPEGPVIAEGEISGSVSPTDTDDWYVFYVEGSHQMHLTRRIDVPPACGAVTLTGPDGAPIPPDYTSPPGTTRFFVHVGLIPGACGASVPYAFRLDPATGFVAGPGALALRTLAEPNDLIEDAGGPLAANTWYFSRFETANDRDWLRFYTRPGRRRVEIQVVTYGGPCSLQETTLHAAGGGMLGHVEPFRRGPIGRVSYRSSRAQMLHLRLDSDADQSSCVGATTVVQVGPESSVLAGADLRAACADARRGQRRWTARVASTKRRLARAGAQAPRSMKRRLSRERRKLGAARRLARVYCP